MISLYCLLGICFILSSFLIYMKHRDTPFTVSCFSIIFLYVLSRGFCFFLMLKTPTASIITMITDLILFAVLTIVHNCTRKLFCFGMPELLYVTNPVILLYSLSGKILYMLLAVLFLLVILLLTYFASKKSKDMFSFYPEYLGFTASLFGMFIATETLEQTLSQGFQPSQPFPVLLIISINLLIFTAVCACCRYFFYNTNTPTSQTASSVTNTDNNMPRFHFTSKDALIILGLSLFCGTLLFIRLGNFKAPESEFCFGIDTTNNEIVLDLGNDTNVSCIDVYLGYDNRYSYSVYVKRSDNEGWEIVANNTTMKSVFCWNQLQLDKKFRYCKISSDGPEAIFHEIVLLSDDHKLIRPTNADEYPSLFDENDCYPEHKTCYDQTVFDEIYHARTAYEYIHDYPIYETTHPTLGKILISLGIRLFGMNPFGWRCVGAVFGVFIVPLMYLFLVKLTNKRYIAFAGSVLLISDFMHFVLSRIATLDCIAGFFLLAMFYFMYCFLTDLKENSSAGKQTLHLVLCGLCTALAISCKWTGFYAVAGLAVILAVFLPAYFAKEKDKNIMKKQLLRTFIVCFLSFIVLPAVIYVISFFPFYTGESHANLISLALDNSTLMLNYHSDNYFSHPYSSEWYEWLVNYQPLIISHMSLDDKISTIALIGNPLITIGGLAALGYNFYLWICKKNHTSSFLCIAYVSQLLPWVIGIRTLFIYHYYPCNLILITMIIYSLSHVRKRKKLIIYGFTALCLLLFVFYYPILSGMPVSKGFVDMFLELIPTWTFA